MSQLVYIPGVHRDAFAFLDVCAKTRSPGIFFSNMGDGDRGKGKAKTFQQAAIRNAGVVIEVIGDKPIAQYTTIDAGKVRDAMIAKGLSVLSVKRTFITVKAIINLAIAEHGLDIRNPFSSIFMPEEQLRCLRLSSSSSSER